MVDHLDSGHHWIIPAEILAVEALGPINFRQATAHSDNVYFYEMGNRLGIDRLEKYARMFDVFKGSGPESICPMRPMDWVANRRYKAKNFEDGGMVIVGDVRCGHRPWIQPGYSLQAAMVMGEIAVDGKAVQAACREQDCCA